MYIVRSPLRISFFGGGTDIPRIYSEINGCVFSATIQKFVYISINKKWPSDDVSVTAKYTILENEIHVKYLKHPIMRTVLSKLGITGVDISVSSDIPGGTGLGSSSAFTVGFLLASKAILGEEISNYRLAESACEVELHELQEPIGKQDSYAAAFGGINHINFDKSGKVNVTSCRLSADSTSTLEESIFLVRIGGFRKTSELLMQQLTQLESSDRQIAVYEEIANQARWASELTNIDLEEFGSRLNEAWNMKKSLSSNISNDEIDHLITLGLSNGACGAKLLGAGGSGFVLFLVPREHQEAFIHSMRGKRMIQPKFDFDGATVLHP
jgi:D-glycero-alpha-D-manno-heptose-7-phosphate kinase